jgi:hypothetical protein
MDKRLRNISRHKKNYKTEGSKEEVNKKKEK